MTSTIICLAILAAPGDASDCWTSFRNGGPSRAATSSSPLVWSPDAGIAWQRELPGYGQSSPVVWGDTVFLTAVQGPMKEKCVVLALDVHSGEPRWIREFEATMQKASNFSASRAAPTPVVDPDGVYAFFESGNLVALTHEGELRWQRSLVEDYGEFQNGHGLGGSPADTPDALFLLIDHSGPSYLLSVEKATGKTRWKTDRESRYSWTSPIVVQQGGQTQVVVSSNGFVDGYEASTGQRLWTLEGVGGNTIPSPTSTGNRLFIGAAKSEFGPSDGTAKSCCLQLSEREADDQVTILWQTGKASSSYASPVVAGSCVYYVNKVGAVYCVDSATGEERYVERIDGPCWATPIVIGEHIYFFGKDGVTTVLKAGPEFSKVSSNALWDPENPPKPETYQEHRPATSESSRGDFATRLKESDKNKDGKLTKDELPESMRGFFSRLDRDSDGEVSKEELAALRERSRRPTERGANDRMGGSYGDPTVYGVAATSGSFFIRTGTRLYCVRTPDNGIKTNGR